MWQQIGQYQTLFFRDPLLLLLLLLFFFAIRALGEGSGDSILVCVGEDALLLFPLPQSLDQLSSPQPSFDLKAVKKT